MPDGGAGDPQGRSANPLPGYLLLFSGMALVGSYVALSRPLTAIMPVFLLAWLRFAIAALAMLGWLRPGPRDVALGPGLCKLLFMQSLFGNFLFSIFMLTGVSMSSATTAGLVLSTMPAVVALLSWCLLRERPSVPVWIAIGLASAGLGLLALGARAPAGGPPSLGAIALLLASVGCESIYVIIGKQLSGRLSARRISALINLVGLVLMTPFGLWQALEFDFRALSSADWALLVFYALAASMFSTWLWLAGLRRVPASHSGVFTIAMPLAASAIGIAWLGERPGPLHGLALACAVAGIVLITRESAGIRAGSD